MSTIVTISVSSVFKLSALLPKTAHYLSSTTDELFQAILMGYKLSKIFCLNLPWLPQC